MANIQSKIQSKYGIDINEENIFKLYKVKSADIDDQELAEVITSTRKRWTTSANGPNEKNAKRDRARLKRADRYEAILKDKKLRKELFNYYNNENNGRADSGGSKSGSGSTTFAKEYFKLIATTKKINKEDVNFFFDYYKSERKNSSAIRKMLETDFKIKGLKGTNSDADNEDEEGKKKDEDSVLITNLFQRATLIKIRRAVEKYEEAVQNEEICKRYEKISSSLYEFIEIDSINNAKEYTESMDKKRGEVFTLRQEGKKELVVLVDMFNILKEIGEYKDVVDNFQETKLLLKYPNLTSYMYSFVDMKPDTLKGMVQVASKEYRFRNDTDFILNYYNPVHDNFGISDGKIQKIIRKAEKKTKRNKILNALDEKIGLKRNRDISLGAKIIHGLVYWPLFAVYLIFELIKKIFSRLYMAAVPVFLVLFVISNRVLPKMLGMGDIFALRKIFFRKEWLQYLDYFLGYDIHNTIELILISLATIICHVAVLVVPAALVAWFVVEFSTDFKKRFDWVGIERTFKQMFLILKRKTESQYKANKNQFFKNKIPKIIINMVSLVVLVTVIYFLTGGSEVLKGFIT